MSKLWWACLFRYLYLVLRDRLALKPHGDYIDKRIIQHAAAMEEYRERCMLARFVPPVDRKLADKIAKPRFKIQPIPLKKVGT